MRSDDPVIKALKRALNTLEDRSSDADGEQSGEIPRRGSLAELIDSDDYVAPYAGPVEGDEEAEIREVKGVVRLVFDPAKIEYEERRAHKEDMDSALAAYDGFPLLATSAIADAVKGEEGKQRMREVVSFYRGKVPPRFRKPLIEGMALRIAEDNSPMARWEIKGRKKQIAVHHEENGHERPEAYGTTSLCSSGYFDSERLLQRIYKEQVEQGSWTDAKYAEAFEELVQERPFVVFVEADGDESYTDAYHEMIGKSLHIDDFLYPVQYIDIRGKGERPQEIVNQTVDYIRQHHSDVELSVERENDQTVARVLHETLVAPK